MVKKAKTKQPKAKAKAQQKPKQRATKKAATKKPKAKAATQKPKAKATKQIKNVAKKAAKKVAKRKVTTRPKKQTTTKAKVKATKSRGKTWLTDNAAITEDGRLEIHTQLTPGMVQALQARTDLEAGDYEAGIHKLTKALALDGDNADFRVGRGQAYYQLGQFAEAIADYRAARELEPSYPDLHFEQGKAELRAGLHKDAEKSFTKDLETGTPSPIAYFNRYLARQSLGKTDAATKDLDAAVAALPDAAPLRKARAETRLAAGDADGALSDLHVALDIHPEDLELRDMRARIEFQLGLYKEAAFDFVKLVELSRAAESAINPHWHAGAALSLAQDNQYEDAVEHLSQAMNLDPLNPAHVANRGWMQFSAGDFVSALTDLDAAIALDPDYERAHLNRQAVVEAMAKQPRS